MKNKANIIVGAIVAVVVVVAVGAYAFMQMGSAGAGVAKAIVHDGDGGVHEFALSENQEQAISTSLGTNVVVVEDGAVYVREADCDNQDCVHQGKVSAPGKQIICLPHKLWIEVVAADGAGATDMNVDAVAGGADGGEIARDGQTSGSDDGKTGSFDAVAR